MTFLRIELFFFFFFLKDFILFLEIGEGRQKERERNIKWLPLTCPNRGPGLQCRPVPQPGKEPATFWFAS